VGGGLLFERESADVLSYREKTIQKEGSWKKGRRGKKRSDIFASYMVPCA